MTMSQPASRGALINSILRDERALPFFERLGKWIGYPEAAARGALGAVRLTCTGDAALGGVDNLGVAPRPYDLRASEREYVTHGALSDSDRESERRAVEGFVSETTRFIESLGLRWGGLGTDLIETFYVGAEAALRGERVRVNYWVARPDPPAPRVDEVPGSAYGRGRR